MTDPQMLTQVVVLVAGALTTVLGALAYAWKRDADRKLLDVQRQADDALQQAQQVTALTRAISRLADSWTRSDERASEERLRFGDVVAANTDVQTRLALALEANVIHIEATQSAVRTLHADVTSLRGLVDALPDATAERMQAALSPLSARLDAIRAELADTHDLLAELPATLP